MKNTLVTVNVHVNGDTKIEAEKVTDFVSLKVGDVDLFLIHANQAARLAEAAEEAYVILREMEDPTPTNVEQMLLAGEEWMRSIGSAASVYDLSTMLRWTIEDWEVVLSRSGFTFIPTVKMVSSFRAKFDRATA